LWTEHHRAGPGSPIAWGAPTPWDASYRVPKVLCGGSGTATGLPSGSAPPGGLYGLGGRGRRAADLPYALQHWAGDGLPGDPMIPGRGLAPRRPVAANWS